MTGMAPSLLDRQMSSLKNAEKLPVGPGGNFGRLQYLVIGFDQCLDGV